MRHFALAVAAVALALAGHSPADTIVPGGNIPTQTWSAAGSPYIVQGDITIPAGSTLTLDPGVTVRFASIDAAHAGLDSSKVEFIVNGTLTCQGTPAEPISLEAQTGTAPATWYGVLSSQNATSSINLANTTIRHAVFGLGVRNGSVQTSRVTLSSNTYGVWVSPLANLTTFSPSFNGITSTANTYGVLIAVGSPRFTNCLISGNTTVGVMSNTLSSTTSSVFAHCTIANNVDAGIRDNGFTTINVYNSIIASNTAYGLIRTQSNSQLNSSYCDVWGNGTANYLGCGAGAGSISVNPGLAAPGLPQLLPGSPCIDTGNPGATFTTPADIFETPRPIDGDRNGSSIPDMGAFEYSCGTPAAVTAPPAPATVTIGQPFTFSVAATGSNLTYQWRHDGVPMPNTRGVTGATTPTLSVQIAGPYDSGAYDVVVTNDCGSVTSAPATLTVNPASPCGSADFNGDGDLGTDADIEAFFRVLAGSNC